MSKPAAPKPPQPPRALSIRQPHMEVILRGVKKVEYRSRPTRFRGRVWLHASTTFGADEESFCDIYERQFRAAMMRPMPDRYPVGGIVGSVEIYDCRPDPQVGADGKPICWHWLLRQPRRCRFRRCKGRLGFFKI